MLNQENPGMSRLLLPLENQALSEATYGSHMAPIWLPWSEADGSCGDGLDPAPVQATD